MLSETVHRWKSLPIRPTLMLRGFAVTKVPLLFLSRPWVEQLDSERCTVRIPLCWLTRNHVGSMYIAVLTMGADVACGLIAMEAARRSKAKVVPIFKDIQATFHKRATGDVRFTCEDGRAIRDLVDEAVTTDQRQNLLCQVEALVDGQRVASFTLTLSVKSAGEA